LSSLILSPIKKHKHFSHYFCPKTYFVLAAVAAR
jgi:hypothetical protein